MRYLISTRPPPEEVVDYTRGKRVITEETRANMRRILEAIPS